jgi:hypothetical protein
LQENISRKDEENHTTNKIQVTKRSDNLLINNNNIILRHKREKYAVERDMT